MSADISFRNLCRRFLYFGTLFVNHIFKQKEK